MHCTHTALPQERSVILPPQVRELGLSLFGDKELVGIVGRSRATRFTWERGNVTLHSMLHDHVEFCTAVREYNFRDDISPPGATVLDIGANVGDTSIQLHRLNPEVNVVALEPMPYTYFFLVWNLVANGVPLLREHDFQSEYRHEHRRADGGKSWRRPRGGVLPIHAGATADGRTVALEWNERYSKNAKEGVPGSKTARFHNVTTRQIPALLAGLGLHERRLPLLKIDCEGCEFDVLPQLEQSGLLERIDRLVGEIHAPRTRTKRQPAYERLKQSFCRRATEAAGLEAGGAGDRNAGALTLHQLHARSELSCFERWYRPIT